MRTPLDCKKGFSLVELLISVAIIAILVAIAIPMYSKFLTKAREVSAISYIHDVIKSEEIYRVDYYIYTNDFEQLEITQLIPVGSGNSVRDHDAYRFTLDAGLDAGGEPYWTVTAEPISGNVPMRWFYSDQTGIIRYETGSAASSGSPAIQ